LRLDRIEAAVLNDLNVHVVMFSAALTAPSQLSSGVECAALEFMGVRREEVWRGAVLVAALILEEVMARQKNDIQPDQ